MYSIWTMNNAGRYFMYVLEYDAYAFRKNFLDDCDEECKFTMYPNGDHIFLN